MQGSRENQVIDRHPASESCRKRCWDGTQEGNYRSRKRSSNCSDSVHSKNYGERVDAKNRFDRRYEFALNFYCYTYICKITFLSLIFQLDSIHLAKEKNRADAEFYHKRKQAEANAILFTPEFLEMKKYESLTNSAKVYYGPNLPKMFAYGDCHERSDLAKTNLQP